MEPGELETADEVAVTRKPQLPVVLPSVPAIPPTRKPQPSPIGKSLPPSLAADDEVLDLDQSPPARTMKQPAPLSTQAKRTKPPLPPSAKLPATRPPAAVPAPRPTPQTPKGDTGEDDFWKFVDH
jgi:hypothetical protein